jgi:hypothetical protein
VARRLCPVLPALHAFLHRVREFNDQEQPSNGKDIAMNTSNQTTRSLFAVITAAGLTAFCSHATTVVWTNSASGNWNVANNWDPRQVPQPGDSVFITNNGTYTVTLNVATTNADLRLGGASGKQTLNLNSYLMRITGTAVVGTNGILGLPGSSFDGNAAVDGVVNWSGGSFTDSLLSIGTNGILNLTSNPKYLTRSVLLNAGKVNWSAGTLGALFTGPDESVLITNLVGGIFDIQSSLNLTNNANAYADTAVVFHNDGTLRKSASGAAATFRMPLVNQGTVEALAGPLQFTLGLYNSGTINISGGSVDLEAGVFTFDQGQFMKAI